MNLKKLDKGEVEFEASISSEKLEQEFAKVLKEAVSEAELPGFRKGKAPEKMVRERIGDAKLLDEASLHLIEEEYPKLLLQHDIRPLGSPKVNILKLALGNPLEFRITIATLPEFDLPDYKSLSKKVVQNKASKEELAVSDKEVDDVLYEIRATGLSPEDRAAKKEPPELNDEMAAMIGNFKSAEELKEKVRENIGKEKEMRAKDKKRAEIIDELLKNTEITVPDVLIESELNKMFATFASDVERTGRKIENYLKEINKTMEDLFKEWRTDAEKNAKIQLIINKIATAEKISPEEKKLEREVEHLLLHYKDVDKERVRIYVETIMTNELVFEFLEGQK